MTERKPFLLRLDPATMGARRSWAGDDLGSGNSQIEYVLRTALREAGRLPAPMERHEEEPAIVDGSAATNNASNGSDTALVPAMQTRSDLQ